MPKKRPGGLSPLAVAERERRLFTSELHDTVCQSLASLSLYASAVLRRQESGKKVQTKDLRQIEARLGHVLDQSRAITAFDVIRARPGFLPEKIREYVRLLGSEQNCRLRFSRAVNFVSPPTIALHFYRIVCETIRAFIRRHDSGSLEISLEEKPSGIVLQIGCTDLPPGTCRKLFTGDGLLRHFSDLIGISWKIQGTTLKCSYPLPTGRQGKRRTKRRVS